VRLILASGSPRRAELLRAAGFAFDVVASDVDERVRDGEAPAIYVRRLAADKSAAAARSVYGPPRARVSDSPPEGGHYGRPEARAEIDVASGFSRTGDRPREETIILAADTAVVVDDAILGKPRDDEEAAEMLRRLSGRWHEVLTGISLRSGAHEIGRVESTRVQFASLSAADIAWYIESGEGRDKAGAYAIQGLASRFIPRVDGSYSNVVGLPTAAVVELLPEIRRRQ
jgi:septum formation protein